MDRNRRARPIDEYLLAGFVLLSQHHVELGSPPLVQLAEPRVAVAVRVPLPVLLPQQLQGQMFMLAQLLVHRNEVGWRARRWLFQSGHAEAWEQRDRKS